MFMKNRERKRETEKNMKFTHNDFYCKGRGVEKTK